jgi:signal transduction histidine kinase
MLLEGAGGTPLNKIEEQFLRQTFNSSQRMAGLISDLLNLSRLKTGKFVIEREPCDLVKIINEELSQLKEEIENRSLELVFKKPDEFPTLSLDEIKTRQVIMNFVDNAIYYTREGGHIVVSLEDKGDDVIFKVTDNGIGVPEDQKKRIFDKFFRAKNAQAARPDGTGIGLFMAKKAVEAQGGSIIFESTHDVGSTFGFEFSKKVLKSSKDEKTETTAVSE